MKYLSIFLCLICINLHAEEITPNQAFEMDLSDVSVTWSGKIIHSNVQKFKIHTLIYWLVEHRSTTGAVIESQAQINESGDGYFIVGRVVYNPVEHAKILAEQIVEVNSYVSFTGNPTKNMPVGDKNAVYVGLDNWDFVD